MVELLERTLTILVSLRMTVSALTISLPSLGTAVMELSGARRNATTATQTTDAKMIVHIRLSTSTAKEVSALLVLRHALSD